MALTETLVRAALASIATAVPSHKVTVRIGDDTDTSALISTDDKGSTPTDMGEQGITVGTVRCDSSKIPEPDRGATIIVDGDEVEVVSCRTTVGQRLIEFQKVREVEGV